MSRYGRDTEVSVERSKAELERTLIRYGATGFYSAWDGDIAVVGFRMCDAACIEQERPAHVVKIAIQLPDRNADEFRYTDTGRDRKPESQFKAWEQACRQRWRAMNLIVKAKLEAIECGISTIEREFLADLVLANGKTVGEFLHPQINELAKGKMPKLLPGVVR